MIGRLRTVLRDERGQTYVEYAVLLAAITAIVLAGWTNLDGAIQNAITNVISAF